MIDTETTIIVDLGAMGEVDCDVDFRYEGYPAEPEVGIFEPYFYYLDVQRVCVVNNRTGERLDITGWVDHAIIEEAIKEEGVPA